MPTNYVSGALGGTGDGYAVSVKGLGTLTERLMAFDKRLLVRFRASTIADKAARVAVLLNEAREGA